MEAIIMLLGFAIIIIGLMYKNKRKIILAKYYGCFGSITAYIFLTAITMAAVNGSILIYVLISGDPKGIADLYGGVSTMGLNAGGAAVVAILIALVVAKKAAKYELKGTTWAMFRVSTGGVMSMMLFMFRTAAPLIQEAAERERKAEEERRAKIAAEKERQKNVKVYDANTGENLKVVDDGESYITSSGEKRRVDSL